MRPLSSTPNGGHVHPMKLVHVFKTAAQAARAEVYENTTVAHIEEGREHLLHTTGGRIIRAKSLVLATNAFTARLGFFRNSIVPVHEYVAVTQPSVISNWPRSDGASGYRSMTLARGLLSRINRRQSHPHRRRQSQLLLQ